MGENKYKFQKLTPVNDIDMTMYGDALDYVFDNSDVRNVAISGAYGAGKSSMLASYKEKNEKLRFLHISLAHFEQPDKDKGVEVPEITLEGKILNQLIHQIPAEKIPQSNFRVKKKVETKAIVRNVSFVLIFLLSLLHIVFFGAWDTYIDSLSKSVVKTFLGISSNPYSLLVSGLLCFAAFGFFVWEVVAVQKNKNVFRKLSLQGNEIEIFEDNEDSYFDKYLNEVLYLFENSGADVIVFEDMDRFNSNKIFERLREINNLSNLQLSKENKPPLRFFYLLRDDIFISKDRTKFFDYIVPVVPVVDSSNSYDQFIAHFKEGGIFDIFDESFLQGLSLYVDEMRILKNIYNEFVVYYNRLNITELDSNKMLAMITYKNIFPRDFSDLQLNRGFVYTLFSNKDSFIKKEIADLASQISQIKDNIQLAHNEQTVSKQELEIIYKERRGTDYYGRLQPLKADDQAEYDKRILALENKDNDNLSSLNHQITVLENQVIRLNSNPMKDIITRSNIDEIFRINGINEIGRTTDFNEIKGSEYFSLLKYLIRNGHIDETYADYMTYFYENSLSRVDKMFLRSITDRKAKEATYELKNPPLVTTRLRLVDFDQEEILNFDLLEYLLQAPIHNKFLDRFMQQLRNTKNFQFIGTYFDSNRELARYVRALNSCWTGLFAYALNKKELTEKQLRLYSISSIYYSDVETIQSMNEEECLTRYISDGADYLDIAEPDIDKLIRGFKSLSVSFSAIDSSVADEELLRAVYENSLYQINHSNIALMLRTFYPPADENDVRHQNYTIVLSQPESPLAEYLNEHIEEYVEVILESSDAQITDVESVALSILNNEGVTNDQKVSYIEQLTTTIAALSDVDDKDLWGTLLSNEIAVYSAENMIEYLGDGTVLDDVLIAFIDGNDEPLEFSTVKKQHNEETLKRLFRATLKCNALSNEKYREILSAVNYYYEAFSTDGLSGEKFEISVDLNIPRMTSESLAFIREHYPVQRLYFIAHHVEAYASQMTAELLDLEELTEILSWDITDSTKIELLAFTSAPLSVMGLNYTPAVTSHILNNNLTQEDIPKLFASYKEWTDDVKQIIEKLAIGRIAGIIAEPADVSAALLLRLLTSENLNSTHKTDLFASSLSKFSPDECFEIFDALELPHDYKKIFDTSKRPSFEVNAMNQKLLTAFADENIIYSFEEDQNRAGYYKIRRTKPISKTLPLELL